MSSRSQQIMYLKDYTPPPFLVERVDLTFDIFDGYTLVKNKMVLQKNEGTNDPLTLDGAELEIVAIKLNDKILAKSQFNVSENDLTLNNLPDHFCLEITTKIYPEKNKSYEGLYCSNGSLVTQNEAQGFRKITYFLDRPDVMTLFSTTLTADKLKYPVLLANGDLLETRDVGDGRHLCHWEDPFKKTCYLHAIVAGNLGLVQDHFTTCGGRTVDLRIYCEKGAESRCSHAMHALKLAMRWDEEKYGREYDLNTYMVVAVDNFNAGAMENKGLNIFNSVYVLADPQTATDVDYANILGVIGHEYFHNWTGNRVTLRDWFQLSLKEGLTVFRDQEFSADLNSRAVKRIDDVNLLRTRQFAEDAGPTAHPVRPVSVISVDNFFTVTIYEKGAELIRMMQTLVGVQGFRKGMDLYFDRHDGQAVTIDDFVAAIEDGNDCDLSQFKLWYDQSGTPRVNARCEYDPKSMKYSMELEQTCPPTPHQLNKKPFHIPIRMSLLDDRGHEIALNSAGQKEIVLQLKENKQVFTFNNIQSRPRPSLLRDFSAPIHLNAGYSHADLAFLLANDTDPFCRWEAGQKLILETSLHAIQLFDPRQPVKVPQIIVDSFAKVIANETLDDAFKARLLTFPEESYFSQFVDIIHVEAIHAVREAYLRQIALPHEDLLLDLYRRKQTNANDISPQGAGQRALKNSVLFLLSKTRKEKFLELAHQQLLTANNMTDECDALSTLSKIDCPQRDLAIDHFTDKWRHESLVINKLLRTVATSPLDGTLECIKDYMDSSIFNPDNPNKVYALILGYGTLNPMQFHHISGQGYEFLADQILYYDKRNPHIGAYLASSFNLWRKLDPQRRALMKAELERIKESRDLSGNTYEIISKNLA